MLAQTPGTGPTSRPVLVFPTTGKGPKEWTLTEEKLAEYQGDYPALDVLAAFRKARNFCINNPPRRKTARGMTAFLTKWLNRETDSWGGRQQNHSAPRIAATRDDSGALGGATILRNGKRGV